MSIHDVQMNPKDNPSPEQAFKSETVTWLFPGAIHDEIDKATREGYDVHIGDTYDLAYNTPEDIKDTFERLHDRGMEYSSEMGKFDVGRQAVLSAIRFGAPAGGARNWAKHRLVNRESKAEALRARLLYDRPDVQAQPWHKQGGTALALGTIVDAHDLKAAPSEYSGVYETMSGRLDKSILDHTFGKNADWLSGLSIREAVIASEIKFKGKAEQQAQLIADQKLSDLEAFVSGAVMPGFRDIIVNCTDSLGLRSRKDEVRSEIGKFTKNSDKDELLMMSVGCGTALPMLEVIQDVRRMGKNANLILLDQDPIALAAAEQFAAQMGLSGLLEIYCEQLFHGKDRKTHLLDMQTIVKGRALDVDEDSGLREYLPDFLYEDLTRQMWGALDSGGLMTTSNMNKNRPQAEFLHGLMGWPIPVTMRKIEDITRLHKNAGIPVDASRLRVTQDGVYTLCFSTKQ